MLLNAEENTQQHNMHMLRGTEQGTAMIFLTSTLTGEGFRNKVKPIYSARISMQHNVLYNDAF